MPSLPEGRCACCGANLDRFIQPVVLAAIAKEPLTGYAIIKRVSEYITFEENGADPTGVYRYLKIMLKKGLIKQNFPNNEDTETPFYTITETGTICLKSWQDTLSNYAAKISILVDQLDIDR